MKKVGKEEMKEKRNKKVMRNRLCEWPLSPIPSSFWCIEERSKKRKGNRREEKVEEGVNIATRSSSEPH